MRPNQRQPDDNLRYRRAANNGRTSVTRIALILVVAIGIVGITVLLANNYEFKGTSEPTQSSSSRFGERSGGSAGSPPIAPELIASSRRAPTSTSTRVGDNGLILPDTTGADSTKTGSSEDTSEGSGEPLTCAVNGRVTDDWGAPMVGVMIHAVDNEGTVAEVVTDSRGRYELPGSISEPATVSVVLTHGTTAQSTFSVMNDGEPISLSVDFDGSTPVCDINFDAWKISNDMDAAPIATALWPDATAVYQNTLNAEALALNLGADLGNSAPLQINMWHDTNPPGYENAGDRTYFIAENELGPGSPPAINISKSRSSALLPGIPDNREYHEYGHYFLALQTRDNFELPAGDQNHGGYYQNASSRDSFVEGFAEFYSMMVSRHVDGDVRPEIYTIGADYDLEINRLPWEFDGWWEEFTIAGLLLDLVDNDSNYTQRADGYPGVNVTDISTENGPGGTIVSGTVANTSPLVVRNADVTVRYLNEAGEVVGTQVTRILPATIAPTREGTFYAAPPEGLGVTGATATLGGLARADDDNVSMGLLRLMSIITGYERSGDDEGSMGVSNVAELYDALVNDDVGTRGAELQDISAAQIDEIFVSHGLYADLDGDHAYDPEFDGAIGASSHPAIDTGSNSYPAFIPRQDPDPFAGSLVTIKTGADDVDAIIQISMPADGGVNSYAYITSLGETGLVELAVPPTNRNAEVTIITAGKGYRPVIAYRVDADNFHKKVEDGSISELQVVPVALEPGSVVIKSGVNSNTIQFGIIIGGIIALLLVVVSLVTIHRQWGKA